jgi:uncharacterized protein (TIGR00730 family)
MRGQQMQDDSTQRHPAAAWGKRSPTITEDVFLEGPKTRRFEFGRALRIFGECIHGFQKFHRLGPCITVFGSARFEQDNPYYELAREVGRRIAHLGLNVMTGGGPGIMEAANRGAKETDGARSIGCNIVLPQEQEPNPYLDDFVEFRYFFVRKVMLVKYSYAFVVFPGGFGTMDEIFETATLIQTGKIRDFPIILMCEEFWEPLRDFMENRLIRRRTIDREDYDRLVFTDDPDEVVRHVTETMVRRFGFMAKRRSA